MRSIWIWQRIVSPHMLGLADSLAQLGHEVLYIAERPMTQDRIDLGWEPPVAKFARIHVLEAGEDLEQLVENAPLDSAHICQGIRGNGYISQVQQYLSAHGRTQWVQMETVNDHGITGFVKRWVYRDLITRKRNKFSGILAIGQSTQAWLVALGMPHERTYPFAYFLPTPTELVAKPKMASQSKKFNILFVGQCIQRKRIDVLINALATIERGSFELTVAGDGPLRSSLEQLAKRLSIQTTWLGSIPMKSVPLLMEQADCLVLPSQHDGWGAVISEALIAGTPAICSDRCGAAGVVLASRVGGVFRHRSTSDLTKLLIAAIERGPINQRSREEISEWANCLKSHAGAKYLHSIVEGGHPRLPPWDK